MDIFIHMHLHIDVADMHSADLAIRNNLLQDTLTSGQPKLGIEPRTTINRWPALPLVCFRKHWPVAFTLDVTHSGILFLRFNEIIFHHPKGFQFIISARENLTSFIFTLPPREPVINALRSLFSSSILHFAAGLHKSTSPDCIFAPLRSCYEKSNVGFHNQVLDSLVCDWRTSCNSYNSILKKTMVSASPTEQFLRNVCG